MPVLTSTEPQLFLPLSLSRAILKDKQPLLHNKAEGSEQETSECAVQFDLYVYVVIITVLNTRYLQKHKSSRLPEVRAPLDS